MNICEKATKFDDGRHKYLVCEITKSCCGFARWCVREQELKMVDKYKNKCKFIKK